MASLRQECTKKTTDHQRNILATPQCLADMQQFTNESLLFRKQLIGCGGVVLKGSEEGKTERRQTVSVD